MPCFAVITIQLADHDTVAKALEEMGLVEGRDYDWDGVGVAFYNERHAGLVRQRYGVIRAEAAARRKGYRAQRKQLDNGKIELVLTR
ncbi:MAG: hypothetical protein Q8R28_23300 [Dehalococcoidia bacterium]|nr:hypothetical protein [Dehalococcoidia bacterium]